MNNRRYLEIAALDRAALIEAVFYEINEGLDLIGAPENVRMIIDKIQDNFTAERNAHHSIPLSKHNKILREKYNKIARALIRWTNSTILSYDIMKYTARLATLGQRKVPVNYLGIFHRAKNSNGTTCFIP